MALGHFFCVRAVRLAYLRIPKCGCTSFEAWLAEHHPAHAQRPGFAPHSPEARETYFDQVTPWEGELGGELVRFTFTRHPESRFVSFYRDKITRPINNEHVRNDLLKDGIASGMSAGACLEALCAATDKSKLNPHVAPQHLFLMRGDRLRVDFVGRLEHMAMHGELLKAFANSQRDIPRHNSVNKKIEAPRLTPTERSMLHEIYREDYRLLGYAWEPPGIA